MVTRRNARQNAPMGSFARKSMPITWIPPPLDYKPRKQRISYSVLTEQEKQKRLLDKYSFEMFGPGVFSSPEKSTIGTLTPPQTPSQQQITPPQTPTPLTTEQRAVISGKKPDLARKITKTMQQDMSLIGQLYLQTIRHSKSEKERKRYRELLQRRCEDEQLFIKWRLKKN